MKNFSTTLRFEMSDYKFKDSNEFYNYLQKVFSGGGVPGDRTVLRMVTVEDKDLTYCADCGTKLVENGYK
jgi:hypothetical protein